MINCTSEIIVLKPDELDSEIRICINEAIIQQNERYGSETKYGKRRKLYFESFFNEESLIKEIKFDENFLKIIFNVNSTDSRNKGTKRYLGDFSEYIKSTKFPFSAYQPIKQGLKLIIFELWKRDVILIPTTFLFGTFFPSLKFDNELYNFIRSYAPKTLNGLSITKQKLDIARRMYEYMPRVIIATTWKKIEDVSLKELAELHRAHLRFKSGTSTVEITTTPIPWTAFLNELLEKFPDRVSYTRQELKEYSTYLSSTKCAEFNFEEYSTQYVKSRKIKNLNTRKNDKSISEKHPKRLPLSSLAKDLAHDAALSYFKQYKSPNRDGLAWMDYTPQYPGREYISESYQSQYWSTAFKGYIQYRLHEKGFESNKTTIAALNLLADYIFLYIPWWKEINPNSDVPFPESPKLFTRYLFLSRETDETDERELPLTLLEIIKLRRTTGNSQYAALNQIKFFFNYIEAKFSENEDIGGKDYKSPFILNFDLPRTSKPFKTTKVAFTKSTYSLLIKYGYAIEAFGDFLLEKSLNNEFSEEQLKELNSERFIDSEKFGYIPYVLDKGILTPVYFIPKVFIWETRNFVKPGYLAEYAFIPHLTTLRVLIVAIETGLRLAGIRWLDERTWDKFNSPQDDISAYSHFNSSGYTYQLYVNTDKQKDESWETLVVFRVRSLMQREQKFQHQFLEQFVNVEVPYQERTKSRFGKILPLFRSASSSSPISENDYSKIWVFFLLGFQDFYSYRTNNFVPFVHLKPTSGTKDNPVVKSTKQGHSYCPISILALSTPHACRASFATNRQGILELSDIAHLIGHTSTLTTVYYQKSRTEDLARKLEASDLEMMSVDYTRFDKSNESFLRPDNEDSALVRSYTKDRDAAMEKFGFMPSVSLWSISDSEGLSTEKIKELRNGPMSLLRFTPTHICPVGEQCPSDIVIFMGGPKRCGICPLALKCIEHLPGIAAKKNFQIERIKYLSQQIKALENSGENKLLEDIWEEMELETNEFLGWQLSEEILTKQYLDSVKDESSSINYHVERPDIVKLHLEKVVKESSVTEFILARLAESNAYPTLQSPQIQAIARNISRRLLSGKNVSDLISDIPGPNDVEVAAKLLKTLMQVHNLSIGNIIDLLENNEVSLPSSAPLRIASDQ